MYNSNSQDNAPVVEILKEHQDILSFLITNQPTKADYIFINNRLSSYIEKETFFKIYLKFQEHGVIAPAHVFEELRKLLVYYKKHTKIAAVVPPQMEKEIMDEELHTENTEVRCFGLKEEEKAQSWLNEVSV